MARWQGFVAQLAIYGWQVGPPAIQLTALNILTSTSATAEYT